ncbi:hypothetical protein [Limnofasciculus baicalensis]|nr:hypothetical protein [Limnofasciculus baicalensis]
MQQTPLVEPGIPAKALSADSQQLEVLLAELPEETFAPDEYASP